MRKKPHGVVGWCVPVAVAKLTGWSPEKVWLEILADRHDRGRRLTNLPGRINQPHGGAHAAEALRVIEKAGLRAIDAWRGTKRLNYAEFLRYAEHWEREHGPAQWLVLQRLHLGYLPHVWTWQDTGTVLPGLPIAKAWRVIDTRGLARDLRVGRPMPRRKAGVAEETTI